MDTDEHEAFRSQLQRQALEAFGVRPWHYGLAPVPLRVRIWRKLTFAYRRGTAIDWRSYNAAEAEARAREAAFVAAMPGRAQAVADGLNERFAHVLPDGLRFEFAAREITHQCPPDGQYVTPCCGLTPFELPRGDRITEDPALVTCGKEGRE
jgi:hypothetical protein